MDNSLEKINRSALKFLVPLTTDEAFKEIVSEAKKTIGGEYGTIFLEVDGELKRVYADAPFLQSLQQRKRGNTYNTFQSNEPYVVDVDSIENFHVEIKEQGIKSIVHIPLSYKDRAIGVLTVHSRKPKEYSKKDLHVIKLYGSLASMAIRKTQLYDEMKKALETRDLFISLASHELRTPLTSLNGYIQLLHNKLSKQDTVEAKWVNELYEESKRLTNLVKELLEINRIKQGELHYELRECTVEQFVDGVIQRYSFVNPERKIIYKKELSDDNLIIIGDSDKLMQMFTGIISNADKFSPPDTDIEVSVRNTKSQLIVTVKDFGEGISRQDYKRVFEGFYKGDNQQTEGLGVGLLLARHIIQFHHGTIQLKSQKKKGTVVEVRLPLHR